MARPTTKSHKCENTQCTNLALKDKYGNYKTYCSDICRDNHRPTKIKNTYANKDMDAILAKRKATNQDRFGVDNPATLDSIKDQIRDTQIEKCGGWYSGTAIGKKAIADAYFSKTGEEKLAILETRLETNNELFGHDYAMQDPDIAIKTSMALQAKTEEEWNERLALTKETKRELYGDENYNNREKAIKTWIEIYGVENPSQNAEVHEKKVKNEYRRKEYIMPSGDIRFVQGYEPFAITELLKTYSESDIITQTLNIPRFTYYDINKKHYYFPDIYIPKDNLIIEIKSQWTYDSNIPRHNMKRDSCLAKGYNYQFMIFDKKGNLCKII